MREVDTVTNEDIRRALLSVRPDDAARERMLGHIRSSAALERKTAPPPRRRWRRGVLLAAALGAAAGLTAAVAAYETDFFGLWRTDLGPAELEIPKVEADGGITYRVEERERISLQGLAGTPEHQASREWEDFLEQYDPDGALLEAVGNGPTGISDAYDAYLCYTPEMAEKIDEICAKYGLRLLGPATVEEDVRTLFARTGTGDVCAGSGSNTPWSGYWYRDGTFLFEGAVEQSGGTVDYQFSRAVKGSFGSTPLYLSGIEDYEQWSYTTENGVELLLANDHASKALIIADRERSFVTVNVLGDWSAGTFQMSDRDVEDFAEAFDFTAVP